MKTAYFFCMVAAGMVAAPIVDGAPSLKDVGDIGKVVDSQGVASVRGKMGSRWTGADAHLPIKPGDWLRTDVRGANALQVRLAGGSGLILGPGTLVEMTDANSLILIRGELEVAPGKGQTVTVLPSEGKSFTVQKGAKVFRRGEGRGIQVLEKEPNWLKGFKGTVVSESMGQLLANVDGRNTPLTLGYHKVTVDIRDQIARTTIEESFVNHTKSRLEGIFYFPLPQDASISGFGMWINGELVEADVVEKQRAREIYETILRERRDPGLLEWTGGNIFKARVFPIFGGSEKRIKITYTQVLPYRKGSYRYSYALQSEMLKANPLRELAVNVRVHSAIPIKKFTCTSHDARVSTTANSAQAEFTAQEYTPNKDFEVEIEIDQNAFPVTMVPHRRGEDGYFLALITPPDEGVGWEREMVDDGDPVNLVILADTSGSMDAAARESQDAFIGALLGSLGEKDSFSIATCDSEVRWLSVEKFAGTREEYVELAREWVAGRNSLGWSDLDKAFASVMEGLEKAGDNTHVIYIGDGVITTGDADPVAFANRLKAQYAGKAGTFHAVAPSSQYEPGVLKMIASLGGGSVRRIAGSDTASVVANKLLKEISAPGIRDLSVTFRGIKTARVYPETLANLPSGKQQVVIGRYLPEGEDQRGEILVKGIRDGKVVEFGATVSVKGAEKGNSFIPRLWARMHLEALLEQGRPPEVKEDVIALSEEFHIMTPYTSFLVLESDADRERFKVKRHFRMRDGERFFADGRDLANYELLQKQMRIAGTWRLNIRRSYLNELGRLGRIAYPIGSVLKYERDFLGGAKDLRGFDINEMLASREETYGNSEWTGKERWNEESTERADDDYDQFEPADATVPANQPMVELDPSSVELPVDPMEETEYERLEAGDLAASGESYRESKRMAAYEYGQAGSGGPSGAFAGRSSLGNRRKLSPDAQYMVGYEKMLNGPAKNLAHKHGEVIYGRDGYHWIHSTGDLESLFPAIGGPSYSRYGREGHPWPAEAIELADSLVRVEKLADLPAKGGVDVRVTMTDHDVRFERVSSEWSTRTLIGKERWLAVSGGERSDLAVNWWTPEERGVIGKGFQLGRIRKSAEGDRFQFPLGLLDGSVTSIASSYGGYKAKVEKAGKDRARLVLAHPSIKGREEIYLIDTKRKILLEHESKVDGKVIARAEFADFVEAGGVWWAKRAEWKDADGKVTREVGIDVKEIGAGGLSDAFKVELARRDRVRFLNEPLPDVEDAKQAALDGKRSFESELVLLQHFALSQQWERADEHFDRMKELAKGKVGMRWLEMRFLGMKRRNEELRKAILVAAKEMTAKPVEGEFALAAHLRNEGGRVMAQNEQHELLAILKPVYGRMPEHTWAMKEWEEAWMWSLQNIGRPDEALEMAEEIAKKYGWDVNSQTQYANMLANRGDRPGAVAYFEKIIGQGHWTDPERNSFRSQMINQMENLQQVEEIKVYLAKLLEEQPDTSGQWAYQRYLSALIRTDEVDRAYDLVDKWLGAAVKTKVGAAVNPAVAARLNAAIGILFGSGYGVQQPTVEERFHKPLGQVVRRFVFSETEAHWAERIMTDYRFNQTDEVRELRKHFIGVLEKRAGELPFLDVRRIANWAMVNDPAVEKDTWQKIVAPLIARWSKEKLIQQRDQWASLIGTILSRWISHESHADFLRRQLEESPESERGRYATILFNHLLAHVWSEGAEREAFDLLYLVGAVEVHAGAEAMKNDEEAEARMVLTRAGYLLALNDWVLRNGFAVLYEAVEKKEELSRTELAAASKEKREEIRERLSKRLKAELEKREDLEVGFAHWLNVERIWVDTLLARDPGAIAAECWEFLGNFDLTSDEEARDWSEVILIGRYLDMLEYLASRSSADPELVARVLKFHDTGIGAHPESDSWKRRKYRLLVALDRPKELKEALKAWVRPGEADSQWRVSLGYLLAELNEIEAAIAEFEAVEKADELRPKEYRVLADWYLVRDQKEKREAALAGYYGTMPDHILSNQIYQRTAQIRQGFENGVPEDLDPEVVTMMTVLLRKTQQPASYIHQVAELYRYTKDFRLLECVPEGILGHTAMQVYPFLQNLASVHEHIRDEATADTIFGQMEKVRKRVVTAIDARGLDLLEMLVRRKASEVLNQPGQHLPMALAAMQRAFKRGWEDGERKQMAGFLYSLGTITQQVLAAEQLSEMEILHREEKADADRMEIGFYRGQLLWQYSRYDEAIEVLEFVLTDVEDVHGGVLPASAQNVLSTYLGYLVNRKQFARAEKEIFRLLDQDLVKYLRYWLINRKYQLYIETLGGEGTVSLGKGEALYHAAELLMLGDLPKADHELRHGVVSALSSLYWSGHRLGFAGAAEDARKFAYEVFDELVPFETMNYQSLVTSLGRTLQEVLGYREGLRFLITRYEKEPASFRAAGQGAWQVYGGTIANYRYYARSVPLGDLEPRLLTIVLSELKRDLLAHQGSYNGIYWGPNNSYFWKEKKDEYKRVAEEVLKERLKSMQTVVYVAGYFHNGLHLYDRAIEVLEDAFKRGILDENGWAMLVSYLEGAGRWEKVVRYLVPLVEFRSDNLNYRTRLMTAYFHLKEKEKLVAVLDAIDARWHEKGWWNEGTLGTVASACYETELWKRAVGYFDELIPMYRRARPNQGVGDGTLSHYYTMLATCHQHLGDTPKAVEAAAGAIVSWGSNFDNREQALGMLRGVLQGAKDLEEYVALLDKEVEETGLENPIVRKALGQVYLGRGDADLAIRHLRLALEAEPNDEQSHRSLVEAFDKKGDAEGAIAQILESVELSRRNIQLFKELGERYERVGRKVEAERARTSIVEALPNESEGHAMLAEIRESQGRWVEAVSHWEQVAEIRALEPTGFLRLAEAQVSAGKKGEAVETWKKVIAKEWPSRFGNVGDQARRRIEEVGR